MFLCGVVGARAGLESVFRWSSGHVNNTARYAISESASEIACNAGECYLLGFGDLFPDFGLQTWSSALL